VEHKANCQQATLELLKWFPQSSSREWTLHVIIEREEVADKPDQDVPDEAGKKPTCTDFVTNRHVRRGRLAKQPTDEAKALFNKENTHRKYLAGSWWAFVARIAAIRPWKQQIKQEIYIQKEREIRERCDIRLDEETPVRRQKRKADCQGICEPALRKQRYACLRDCGHHREEFCFVSRKGFGLDGSRLS
jgi:hypothetical protein